VFKRGDKEVLGSAAAAFSAIAMVMAFVAMVAVARSNNTTTTVVGAGTPVTETDFKIAPDPVTVPVDGALSVTNSSTNGTVHNLAVQGTNLTTSDIAAGASASLSLKGLKAGTYTIYCKVPGHAGAGMKATLIVGSGSGAGVAAQSGSAGASAQQLLQTNAADDAMMRKGVNAYAGQLSAIVANYKATGKIDPALYKPNTSYGAEFKRLGGNPLLGPPVMQPKVLADGTKQYTLTAKVISWEIEPGKSVSAWAYNGMVPGPTIKVNPGDKVAIVLQNRLPQSTALHFHGIEVPIGMDGVPFVTQDVVLPGANFTYSFTVPNKVAFGMYHSHHHAEHQVPDGLEGAFIVGDPPVPAGYDPAKQFPAANTPYVMVLNDAGSIGLSLNGKSFPATAPVVTPAGDWIEIGYVNEGLQIHPMHLHGLPQLVIAKDGNPLPVPYTADTVLVAPGERYTVLVKADTQFLDNAKQTPFAPFGVWAFHCHILTHAERSDGMFGMVTTFIVLP
jgi:FtsP/CotA-like multicopper oxidase with cupredoxin domain/plastocyanin